MCSTAGGTSPLWSFQWLLQAGLGLAASALFGVAGFPAEILHCTVRQPWCWASGIRSDPRASAETPEKDKEQEPNDHL